MIIMKKSLYWIFGDAFTKIGGGIFGGIMVAFYANIMIFSTTKNFNVTWYLIILGVGTALILTGYASIWKSGYLKKIFE